MQSLEIVGLLSVCRQAFRVTSKIYNLVVQFHQKEEEEEVEEEVEEEKTK